MARLNPYLTFDAVTREAMHFYASVFGGEPTFTTFAEFPMPGIDEAEAAKVMHSELVTTAGFTLMAADVPQAMGTPQPGSNGTIAISGDEADGLRDCFAGLAEGGTVTMPLDQAPWGDTFGQLTDKFGVDWMVSIAASPAAAD